MFSFSQTICKKLIKALFVILIMITLGIASGNANEIGIITSYKLNIRIKPDRNSRTIKVLNKGTSVTIISHLNEWIKVTHNGETGYIRNREIYVKILKKKLRKSTVKKKNIQITTITEDDLGDIDKAKAKAKDINREIKKQEAEVREFSKKESIVISGLNEIGRALNKSRKRVSILKKDLAVVEKQISATNRESNELIKTIRIGERYTASRMVALYKLNLLGKMHIMASADSMYDLIQRKVAVEHILYYDDLTLKNHLKNKVRLRDTLEVQKQKKNEKLSIQNTLNEQIRKMTSEKLKRSSVLKEIRNKKSLELASIQYLKLAAKDLDKTIVALQKKFKPFKKFSAYKGKLKMPVKGKIVTSFGKYNSTKFNVVNFRSGIDIKAERGKPIKSVGAGQVLYASWFKGYGNIIIVDHGDSYYTIYAHADELLKKNGDKVKTDDIIATVGDTGSMIGPSLYFEVRHHGKPINPIAWLRKS